MRPRILNKYKYYKWVWEWWWVAIVNSGKTFRMTRDWTKCLMAWNGTNPEKAMNDDWYEILPEEKDRWSWDDWNGRWRLSAMLDYNNAFSGTVYRYLYHRFPWGDLFNDPWTTKAEDDLRKWKIKYLYVW